MLVARDMTLPRVGDPTHTLPFRPFLHPSAYRSAVSSKVRRNKRDRQDSRARARTPSRDQNIFLHPIDRRSRYRPPQMLRDDAASRSLVKVKVVRQKNPFPFPSGCNANAAHTNER